MTPRKRVNGTEVAPELRHQMSREKLCGKSEKRASAPGVGISVQSGFTLLEVIVTLTILGFILLMVSGTFRLGLSSWERGDDVKEDYQKIRMVSQLVSRQVKSLVPYKIRTEKAEGNYLAFDGKAHSLRFVSALPIKARRSEGFVYVVYQFKDEGGKKGKFVLYEQRALNRDFFEDDLREDSAVTLLGGVSQVRFEYYREADKEKNRTEEWVEEWNAKEEKELPRALRMTLTYWNERDKEEAAPVTVLASVSAYQFEELRTGPTGLAVPMGSTGPGGLPRRSGM
ncbi:MAG TPA: type II secretion system protein GspJ [Thermodesulfobacteriota bacterium]|nr:type II secretion system protein GspJ [Thermodesulfobacteriota bacterium]